MSDSRLKGKQLCLITHQNKYIWQVSFIENRDYSCSNEIAVITNRFLFVCEGLRFSRNTRVPESFGVLGF